MKILTIVALIGAQLALSARPALAADSSLAQERRVGAFGGLSVRLPLDGNPRQRRLRAGLTLAPALYSRSVEGAAPAQLRIGEGLELGLADGEPMRLSIAGQDVRRVSMQDEDGDDGGIPTWVLVAGGIIVAVGGGLLILIDSVNDSSD